MIRTILIAVLILAVSAPSALALRDSARNRQKQADRYVKVVSIRDMMRDATEEMAEQLPEKDREVFRNIMNRHLDIKGLENSVKQLMVKHFTADEIKALTDFYGSRAGMSVMKKFGKYSAETIPLVQDAVVKAIKKAEQK